MIVRRLLHLFSVLCFCTVQYSPSANNSPVLDDAEIPSTSDLSSSDSISVSAETITLYETGFEPDHLSVEMGSEVAWYNATSEPHILQSGEPYRIYLPFVPSSLGTVSGHRFESKNTPEIVSTIEEDFFRVTLQPGETYTHTFTSAQEFPYFLANAHHYRGKVVVTYVLDAPPLDRTVATTVYSATHFLYSGENPIQTGMDPETIDPVRVVVLRGRVLDREDEPLSNVAITILNHPEYGSTMSRADGVFDMVVNGGGELTIQYEKDGYLPLQRQVRTPWQDYVWAPDVVLISLDPVVTTIDLTQTIEEILVAQGSVISDDDGTRQATLLFPQGVQAELILPGDTSQTLNSLNVRLTEYTVGENGSEAMPAELPPNVAYTYAVELSADEAIAAGATDVRFDRPLYFYVQDFIGFPVGSAVPAGYYDKDAGEWVAMQDGRVVEILDITAGLANLDTDGDGIADNGIVITPTMVLTITTAEREKLAELYPEPPQTLWRVPVTHFTPCDWNWPYGCSDANEDGQADCEYPDLPDPETDDTTDIICEEEGSSVIECQNQVLGERLPIVGTPFSLNYRSSRTQGRSASYHLNIPITRDTLPIGLNRVLLNVHVAGHEFHHEFPAEPGQIYKFTDWDGTDAYGRLVQGVQPYKVCVTYVYPMVYGGLIPMSASGGGGAGGLFAVSSGVGGASGSSSPVAEGRRELWLTRCWHGSIGVWDAVAQGLGGWSLDVQHAYEYYGRTLYLGDGSRRSIESIGPVINTIAGGGFAPPPDYGDGGPAIQAQLSGPYKVAVAPDGGLYIADTNHCRIRRVGPDSTISTVAGTTCGFDGDGGLAVEAQLNYPEGIALGSDGSLYIADTRNNRVRKVGGNGVISTVAGGGTAVPPDYGNGGLATEAFIYRPKDVEVSPAGYLYIAHGSLIRQVGPDGYIWTLAGTGSTSCLGDGGLAVQATVHTPTGLALAPDGSLYYADHGCHRIRQVTMNGIITTTVGTGSPGFSGDGGLATSAQLDNPTDVALTADGGLLIPDRDNFRLRFVRPDGIITTFAGVGVNGYSGDGGPATRANLGWSWGIGVGPDGGIYWSDLGHNVVRLIASPLSGFNAAEMIIPSEDGGEVYQFNSSGRHLRTLHALTGAVLYEFGYDESGFLVSVEDGDGNVTTIERDAEGHPTAIVAPYGQRTRLSLDLQGHLSRITNPAGETEQFIYSEGGLITFRLDPRGNIFSYTHDELGRLERAQDPAGGFKELVREEIENGHQVSITTSLGRTTTYSVQRLPDGGKRLVNTFPNGLSNEALVGIDGSSAISYTNGMVTTKIIGPDPRWGMLAPYTVMLTTTLPSGITYTVSTDLGAILADPQDPLSLESLFTSRIINGREYTSTYTAATNIMTATTPLGRQNVMGFGDDGRVVSAQTGNLDPFTFEYDLYGRLITINQGSGEHVRVIEMSYNPEGYVHSITDALEQGMVYAYDNAGRTLTETSPGGGVLSWAYDAGGNKTGITPPNRPAHTLDFNVVNLLESYDPPDVFGGSDQTQYFYDVDRQLANVLRPDGLSTILETDSAGRVSALDMPHGRMTYEYDPLTGNIAQIITPAGITQTFSYDGLLLVGESWTGEISGVVSYTLNNNFIPFSTQINGEHTITFEENADALVVAAGELSLDRDVETGLVISTTLGGISTALGYNGFGEQISQSATGSVGDIFSQEFVRDPLGRIIEKTETILGETHTYTYTYDVDGRLTEQYEDGIVKETFTYDDNDNRLSHGDQTGITSCSYDDQDRLEECGLVNYSYTANGELLNKTEGSQTTVYTYDVLGNLTNVSLPDGTEISYLVDGLNRRVGKLVDGTLVQGFLYKDHLVLAELNAANEVVSRFVYASGRNAPDYMIRGGVSYSLIADHLGSPRLVVNSETGEIAQRLDYDVFGEVILDSNPGFQPFGFAGGLYDQHTQLTRFWARDYDAMTGRWTAKDPILFAGGNPNLYAYVSNDPMNYKDPLGLLPKCVGEITYIKGDVDVGPIDNQGGKGEICVSPQRIGPLSPGSCIYAGEKIVTGKKGRVKVRFLDGSEVAIGANTELEFFPRKFAKDIRIRILLESYIHLVPWTFRDKLYFPPYDDQFDVFCANCGTGVRG